MGVAMQRWTSFGLIAATLLALAGCADTGTTQTTSEQENHRALCQKWTGNPDDPKCLSTFRRILP
jgi:hypothetical protein